MIDVTNDNRCRARCQRGNKQCNVINSQIILIDNKALDADTKTITQFE